MAIFQFLLFLCTFAYILNQSHAQISYSPASFAVLPVTKDPATLQYLTKIYHGALEETMELVVDLGGPSIWVDCASGHVSSSRRLIPNCSVQCATAKPASDLLSTGSCFYTTRPTGQHTPCDLSIQNSITRSAARGKLVEDILTVQSIGESRSRPITTVDQFLLFCAPKFLLNGLPCGVHGMLGLGVTRISLPSQLASKFRFQRKFVTCLSSSDGVILFGNGPGSASNFGTEIVKSLVYTPLVTKPRGTTGSSQEYFIEVRSIRINGKRLSLSQEGIGGGTKLSTTVSYTTLESSIYSKFVRGYMKAAAQMNMTSVAPVAPFDLCFSSKGIIRASLGSMVPTIDLVLQSEMVKWRLHGSKAMVPVNDEVMCLGFLHGGLDWKPSIVLGGFQLEDTLLEFNLGTSMLGFSSSLFARQTSCSNLLLQSMLNESL